MRSSVYESGFAEVRLNMTPLIDVVFLLMIFFLLVAQIQRAVRVEMSVPAVASEAAVGGSGEESIVINVAPSAASPEGARYRLGTRTFGGDAAGLRELEAAVRRAAAARGLLDAGAAGEQAGADAAGVGPSVLIRADRAEDYERVEPVLGVVASVGLRRVRLVVRETDGEGRVDSGDRGAAERGAARGDER